MGSACGPEEFVILISWILGLVTSLSKVLHKLSPKVKVVPSICSVLGSIALRTRRPSRAIPPECSGLDGKQHHAVLHMAVPKEINCYEHMRT